MKFLNSLSNFLLRSQIHWLPRYFILFKLSGFKKGEIVLDAGCGQGLVALSLARRGLKVIGIDKSKDNISQAVQLVKSAKLKNPPYFIVSDLRNLALGEICFDRVISLDTLELIKEDYEVLGEFFRILKPTGKLTLTVPQGYSPSARLFIQQRILRKLMPGFLLSRDLPQGASWLAIDENYLAAKLGTIHRYTLDLIKKITGDFFIFSKSYYFLKMFSSLATDITYGIKGLNRFKFIFFYIGVRLDYYFQKKNPGYGLLVELIKK